MERNVGGRVTFPRIAGAGAPVTLGLPGLPRNVS